MTDDPSEFIVRRGRLKGRTLGSLNDEELLHVENSKAKDEASILCREYARLAREFGNAAPPKKEQPPLEIVPFRPVRIEGRPVSDKKEKEKFVSIGEVLFDLACATLKFFKIPVRLDLIGAIKFIVIAFVLCCIYPPLARTPGQFFGIVACTIWERIEQVCYEFYSAFAFEIKSILYKVWSATDSLLTGRIDEETFPFGKAVFYGILGYVGHFAMQLRVIPRGI